MFNRVKLQQTRKIININEHWYLQSRKKCNCKKTYIEINYNAKENRCLYQFMNKDINVIAYTMYNQENH